jgi:hypothetical protein
MSLIQSKRIYYINSANRLSGTDSDFSYKIDINPHDGFDSVCVLQCSIPKSFYLVSSGSNTFTLQEGASNVTVTLAIGNYVRSSFKNVLQSALNSTSPHSWVYTVSFPASTTADTGLWTISVTGNAGVQPSLIFTTNLYRQMGFTENSTNTFVSNSITSVYPAALINEDTLYLHSNICSNGQDSVLQEVFTGSNSSFSNITFLCPSIEGYSKQLVTNSSSVFHFTLADEDGTSINLNGQNLLITLLLYKKNEIWKGLADFMKLISELISPSVNNFSS